ncbi:MAG TPA: VWA domain-containing protein [Candidatus Angelobacter sp.]|nr:VWA domain-containing protein [Candidatus Angelobacter sp.]
MTFSRVPFSSLRGLALVSAALMVAGLLGIPAARAQAPLLQPGAANAVPPGSAVLDNDDQPVHIFRTRTDEVNVIFTVTDKHNKFVKDLKESQFQILDNNLPPQQIMDFEAETNMPLRVGLLIDASYSIQDRFQFEQQAAAKFLRQIIRPNTDQAFVVSFDDVSRVTQDFTSDMDKLTHGINVIRPGGGTALWDAVYRACKDKLMKENEDSSHHTLRKAIVVVSDGDDNQSQVTRRQAFEMAQRAGVIVYAISTNLSNILETGDHNLKLLADATGGRAFFPYKLKDLTEAFRSISEELRSQYSVSYKPADFRADGEYRPIKIIAENKHLRVRAKKGYYVQK